MSGRHLWAPGEQLFFRQQIDQWTAVFVRSGMTGMIVVIVRVAGSVTVVCVDMRLMLYMKCVVGRFAAYEQTQTGQQHGEKSGE